MYSVCLEKDFLFEVGSCVRAQEPPNWSRELKDKDVFFHDMFWFIYLVYPQKQQYAYGYAYPGPYAYGSQYGPYNY